MKKLNVILSITLVLALISAGVFAAEEDEDKEFIPRGRGQQMRGMGRMTGVGCAGAGCGWMMRGRGPGRGRGMGGGVGALLHLADELGLSEAQRDDIEEIMTRHQKDVIKQRAEIEIAQVDLQKLIRQEDPDLAAIEDGLQDIAMMQAAMKFSQIKVRVDVKNVLTEEQQEALKELMKERAAERPVRGRGRMGGGPRPMRRRAGR